MTPREGTRARSEVGPQGDEVAVVCNTGVHDLRFTVSAIGTILEEYDKRHCARFTLGYTRESGMLLVNSCGATIFGGTGMHSLDRSSLLCSS